MHPCCCCCTSRTGSMVIGVLELISSIYFLVMATLIFVSLKDGDENYKELKIASIVAIAVSACLLILAIALITGIRKNHPGLVKLWLGVRTVLLIVTIANFLVALVTAHVPLSTIISNSFSILFTFWWVSVVFHFLRHEMPERYDGRVYQQANPPKA